VLADSDNKGVLGQQGFSIAVKLIAHAQSGKTPSAALINVGKRSTLRKQRIFGVKETTYEARMPEETAF